MVQKPLRPFTGKDRQLHKVPGRRHAAVTPISRSSFLGWIPGSTGFD
jgi:hypothetical protein